MSRQRHIIVYALLLTVLSFSTYAQQVSSESDKKQTSVFTQFWQWLSKSRPPTPSLEPDVQAPQTDKTFENKQNSESLGEGAGLSKSVNAEEKQEQGIENRTSSSANFLGEDERNSTDNQHNEIDQTTEHEFDDTSQASVVGLIKDKTEKIRRPEDNKKIQEKTKQHQEEIATLCKEVGGLLSSVSIKGCLSHNFSHGGAYSVKGRSLVYKDVYPDGVSAEQANQLAKVLVIGGIHGDEYSSFSIIFRWLERLSVEKNTIQQYWRLIPAANPDGLLSFKPAQRMNANGVDLNRNFLTNDWRDKAIEYWESKTGKDARRNPGRSAASEPETIWLSELIAQWQPDVIVSVHAPYGILDFDATDKANIRAPNKIGMLHLKLLGTYPGSLGRYAALNRGIPVLTMELPHAGIMPSKKERDHLWEDLQHWLNKNI